MSSQNYKTDAFCFKGAAFLQSLKSKIGLAASKAAALSINLNSTCPPLSPSPHANNFVKGNVIINTHTHIWCGIGIQLVAPPGPAERETDRERDSERESFIRNYCP
jgi:hypothetical protein